MTVENGASQTCGNERDLWPANPGRIVLRCSRKPHKGGKHSQRDEQGRVTEQWWGPDASGVEGTS